MNSLLAFSLRMFLFGVMVPITFFLTVVKSVGLGIGG